MWFMRNSVSSLLWVALLFLSACSSISNKLDEISPEKKAEYKKSQTLPALEVPPDLTKSTIDDTMAVPDIDPKSSATLSSYTDERGGSQVAHSENVLPQQSNIRFERDGDKRWLVMEGAPETVWPKVREFFLQSGFLIKEEDPRIGIMETDWMENRADIPKDAIRSVISKVFDALYSSATRDKYRVRLERGKDPNSTELFLSHRGVEEVVQGTSTIWQSRPSDPELEIEMLNRMAVFFGVDEQKAKSLLTRAKDVPHAQLTRDAQGNSFLSLDEDFSRGWRRTGIALDRVGFTVEDRDRSRGLYYVRYADPLKEEKKDGYLSKLKFWGNGDKKTENMQYLVSVTGEGATTRITILNKDGAPENSETSNRILALLHEQLK